MVPPRPHITQGPNWGSCRAPTINSGWPRSICWIRISPFPSTLACNSRHAVASASGEAMPSRTNPCSVLCTAPGISPLSTTG